MAINRYNNNNYYYLVGFIYNSKLILKHYYFYAYYKENNVYGYGELRDYNYYTIQYKGLSCQFLEYSSHNLIICWYFTYYDQIYLTVAYLGTYTDNTIAHYSDSK